MQATKEATTRLKIQSLEEGRLEDRDDELATEEPLEIRILKHGADGFEHSTLTVTMRTPVPGQDFEIAAGFLFTEGAVREPSDIRDISYCRSATPEAQENTVNVVLRPGLDLDWNRLSRNVFTNSSCGMCGKTSLEAVRTIHPDHPVGESRWPASLLSTLPDRLHRRQTAFARTGGIHAAALFEPTGSMELMREDVGRHNAMDKVIGSVFLREHLPAADRLMLVSGRAGYELVQKTIMAGIPIMASVGAPTSLAVDLAREYELTLIGFLRDHRFNVYSGEHRVTP